MSIDWKSRGLWAAISATVTAIGACVMGAECAPAISAAVAAWMGALGVTIQRKVSGAPPGYGAVMDILRRQTETIQLLQEARSRPNGG